MGCTQATPSPDSELPAATRGKVSGSRPNAAAATVSSSSATLCLALPRQLAPPGEPSSRHAGQGLVAPDRRGGWLAHAFRQAPVQGACLRCKNDIVGHAEPAVLLPAVHHKRRTGEAGSSTERRSSVSRRYDPRASTGVAGSVHALTLRSSGLRGSSASRIQAEEPCAAGSSSRRPSRSASRLRFRNAVETGAPALKVSLAWYPPSTSKNSHGTPAAVRRCAYA